MKKEKFEDQEPTFEDPMGFGFTDPGLTQDHKDYRKRTRVALDKFAGITHRLNIIFQYHYDQILRDAKLEFRGNADMDHLLDALTIYMEEDMNWPNLEDIEAFKKDISGWDEDES